MTLPVVVVVLQDMAHLRGVGGSQGSVEGGSLPAHVDSLQKGDRDISNRKQEDKILLYRFILLTASDHQELLKHST